jgi:hypothetical protein
MGRQKTLTSLPQPLTAVERKVVTANNRFTAALTAVPPNVPHVSGALRGVSSPFLRFLPLLAFGPCGAGTDYGSRGWGFESSWAHWT